MKAHDEKSSSQSRRIESVTAILTAIAAVATLYLDHESQLLGAAEVFYVAISPFLQLVIGVVAGYLFCKLRHGPRVADRGREKSLAKKFNELTKEERRIIVKVYIADRQRVEADQKLRNMLSNGILIKDYLQIDGSGEYVILQDSCRDMLDGHGQLVGNAFYWELKAINESPQELKGHGAGTHLMKGDAAFEFIRTLPENLRNLLRKIYGRGGTIEENPLDGELQELNKWGIVSRPQLFTPYLPCTWSLSPGANMALRDHPDLLDGESSDDVHRLEEMKGFSKAKARAIIRAVEADGMLTITNETEELEIIASVQKRESVFVLEALTMGGISRTGSHYGIHDEWRSFLSRGNHLQRLRNIADSPISEASSGEDEA